MTNIEQDANTEARHGNREALEAMTRRCERLEAALRGLTLKYDEMNPMRTADYHTDCDCLRCWFDIARAALSDTPEVT